MQSREPDVSFERVVKHLFRHLHEPHLLRKNRLVKHLFEDPRGAGKVYEQAVLERIHDLVRLGAAYCRDADLAAGRDERAMRQHTILIRQCLDQRPIREVARELGISYYHCYRQRSEACRRVARFICERDDAPALDVLPELDEFQCAMDRTMQRAACLDAKAAYRESDALVGTTSSAVQRVEALRLNAIVSMRFHDIARAERAYESARAIWNDQLADEPSSVREVGQACIELIAAKLAFHHGSPANALVQAQRATARLHPLKSDAAPRIEQLYVESIYELGAASWNLGDFDKGYDFIADAEAYLSRLRAASPRLRVRISVEIWQLRNYLLMNSKSWYPSWQRRKGLTAAFEQAYAAGAFFEAASALVALAEHHAFAGNDDETLRTARHAVLLAKQEPSESLRAQISIQLAMMLLWTKHWDRAFAFLPAMQRLEFCDIYHRELVSYFAAECAFRRSAFQDAWKLTNTDTSTEHIALRLRKKLIAAAAAYELERRRDAGVLIEATVPAAKRLGSAPILRDTYNVAARITGDIRFKRQANELARLLTA